MPHTWRSRFLVVAISLTCLPVGAGRTGPLDDALRAMADSDLGRARAALERLIGPGKPLSDQALLLEARAQFTAGQIARAAETYRRALKTVPPGSPAALQARLGLAECLARQGSFDRAEALFAEALEALGSTDRREQLARRYLRLADEALEPPEGRGKPNPAQAEQLYRAALDLQIEGQLAEQTALAVGRCLSEQQRHAEAAAWYATLLEELQPRAGKPADPAGGPARIRPLRAAEVQLLAAEALVKASDPRGARRHLRDLLADQPQSRWAADAAYLLSRTFGMPQPGNGTDLARGQAALRRFIARHPKHEKADSARLELGTAPMGLGRQAEAEDELRALITAGGPEEILAEARYQLGVSLATQGRHEEAAGAYRDYLKLHPAHKFWSQARAGIEQMHWERAEAAWAAKRFSEAGQAFAAFGEQHAAAARAPEALHRAAQAYLEAKQPDAALGVLATLTGKFATHDWGWRGLLLTGQVLEEHKGDFTKAREAYEHAKQAESPVAAEACARLDRLEQPSLLVEAPENFSTGPRPKLTWHVRNIEQVTVRAFRIQAEDFFRDRLAMDAVTAVDIALCEPDRTWTVRVKDYRKLARIEQQVSLPFERPGLYLLNLTAGDLEATTAVRISDLGLLVKTGAGEVFGFAQDLRQAKPWRGVRLLVTDGKRLLFEGTTGADGVWRAALSEDVQPDRITVFAVDGDHLAWAGQSNPSVQQPIERTPRAFVFSERPVYRPGDQVHISGIYRGVQAGRYAFAAEDNLQFSLRNESGALIDQADLRLDEYGTFHRALQLDEAAGEGLYRFYVQRGSEPGFSGSFQVREFRRLPFELQVILDQPVFYRGEPLTGVIQVRHPQGAPAAEQEVRYLLQEEGKVTVGRTDSAGQVRFSYPTRAWEETARLTVQAHLGRSHQMAESSALLAVTGFDLQIDLKDRTLFAGQPFQVQLLVQGPDGQAQAAEVKLEAMRRGERAGGERRAWSGQVQVSDSGQASATLELSEPGAHVLRASAVDRAGNPVVAERAIRLVGKQEPGIWLEVTGEEQVPGQNAKLVIHSRLERALVLLTSESERVLAHRSLVVRRGDNPIELPIDDSLAPNFQLAAAVLDGDLLHQASRSVRVSQQLTIQLRSDKPSYAPGEEVTLTLTATDREGRPKDARLLVAVVDQSLLAAYPENLPDLLTTFHIPRPEGEVETCASNTERFAEVEGREVERAEVREAEGSAAMAALSSRRKAMTKVAISEFDGIAGRDQIGFGGLGTFGYGSGGGGLAGRGMGRIAAVRTGHASVRGGLGPGWRRSFEETAVFLHDLRTGPDGVASAVFALPDSITRWRVTARGVTRDTLLGEARHELVASRDFWVQLVAPPVLEASDKLAPMARVFNLTPRDLEAQIELEQAGVRQQARVQVPAGRTGDHLFASLQVPADQAGGFLTFGLSATAGQRVDRLERKLPIRARGVQVITAAEGLLTRTQSARLTLAPDLRSPSLVLALSNRLEQFFLGDRLDGLLFADRPEQALVALEILELLGPQSNPAMRDLALTRLRPALSHLRAVQRSDGGWGLSRGSASSDLEVSATALRVLARAKPHAAELRWPFPQDALDRAAAYLGSQLPQIGPDDHHSRAEVLWALAHLGAEQVPSVALHRLHRLRAGLPPGAQALLGLTWLQLARPEQAAEVAASIEKAKTFVPVELGFVERWYPKRPLSNVDRVRILELLAQVKPSDPAVAEGQRWLTMRGALLGWRFPREAAAALRTLARLAAVEGRDKRARVSLRLNGQPAGSQELSGEAAFERLTIDPALLQPGDNLLQLEFSGSGSIWYRATLTGHRDEAPQPEGPAKPPVRIARHIEPEPADYKGHAISSGFGVVTGQVKPWYNDVDRIPAGTRLQVTVEIERDFARPLDHCVLLERIPPGFELQSQRADGDQTHLMVDGRRLAFFLGSSGQKMWIRYGLVAINPGDYRFAPAQLISLSYPDVSQLGPASDFQVLPPDAAGPTVRSTPQELYQRGLLAAEEGEPAVVIRDLEALWEGFEIRGDLVDDVLGKLLFASIDTQDHPRILKYFELAKEKNPSLVIPFERIAPVQQAYRVSKAYEGGLHLARGLAEARFVRELKAVGLLESLDEMAEAMDLLRSQLAAYPHNELTAKAAYSFSQVIYGRADRLSQGEPLEGFDRPGLLDEVIGFMAGFLGRHPNHPEAPAALFSLSSALVERDQPAPAIAWCGVGLARHADSDLAPALAYLKAFAHFRRGEYGPSLQLCEQVESSAKGQEHKDMARYIMAQIHHARGHIDQALRHYRLVAERFRDAAETVRELEQAWFSVPEVIRAPTGRKPKLAVTARNIANLDLRAYRVDLMKLYLLKRSLRDLADVNLAGIRPILSQQVRLRSARGAGPVEQQISLDLPGRGAYLLLSRSGSQVFPSLVLVGALELEVTEVTEEGRVRVTVRDSRERPLSGARVELKGTTNERFTVGSTDLRGIFIGDEIEGAVTVIAEHLGAYGLYRGTQTLTAAVDRDDDGVSAPKASAKRRAANLVIDFDERLIQGQTNNAPAALEFFNQDVKGMAVEQAK